MTGGTQQKPSQVGATIRVMREQAGLTQKGRSGRRSPSGRYATWSTESAAREATPCFFSRKRWGSEQSSGSGSST